MLTQQCKVKANERFNGSSLLEYNIGQEIQSLLPRNKIDPNYLWLNYFTLGTLMGSFTVSDTDGSLIVSGKPVKKHWIKIFTIWTHDT